MRVIKSVDDAVAAIGEELGVSRWVDIDQGRIERPSTHRTRRLKAPIGELRGLARPGPDQAMLFAAAKPFAINHHRTRQGQPLDLHPGHRRQQLCGPGVEIRRMPLDDSWTPSPTLAAR